MDLGFDPNTPNASLTSRLYRTGCLLYIACRAASCEIVECLLKHGAIIQNSRAMRSESNNGMINVLEALFKYGGDVNEVAGNKDINGPPGTPLYVAAAAGKEDVVRWLLAHGTDVTMNNCEGRTAKNILEENGMVITSDNN